MSRLFDRRRNSFQWANGPHRFQSSARAMITAEWLTLMFRFRQWLGPDGTVHVASTVGPRLSSTCAQTRNRERFAPYRHYIADLPFTGRSCPMTPLQSTPPPLQAPLQSGIRGIVSSARVSALVSASLQHSDNTVPRCAPVPTARRRLTVPAIGRRRPHEPLALQDLHWRHVAMPGLPFGLVLVLKAPID